MLWPSVPNGLHTLRSVLYQGEMTSLSIWLTSRRDEGLSQSGNPVRTTKLDMATLAPLKYTEALGRAPIVGVHTQTQPRGW